MSGKKHKVVIIGGGITGLTSAFYLQNEIKQNNLPIEFKLVEASRRLGGKIKTVRKDGFVIETGPDSLLTKNESFTKLVEKLGIQQELIESETDKTYVISNDKLYLIPEGAVVGIPTQISPFILSSLFSFSGKVRAAADLIIPRLKEKKDVSIGQFFRRRFGDEVVENLIEPLLSGIYAGDIDQLSLKAIFPQFYEVEKRYRSLIIGTKRDKTYSNRFLTLRNGLESIVESMEEKLEESSIMKGIRVVKVEKSSRDQDYEISLNNGEHLEADSVIIALPHYLLPNIFPRYDFFEPLSKVPATSVATVAMAFSEEAIRKNFDGTGFVVARNSDYTINACTWSHKKWPHSTPDGKVLLRNYIGRAGDETVVDLSDAEIEQIVFDDLNKLVELSDEPDFTIVSRWKNAMPQYTIGHEERVKALKDNIVKNLPGVIIGGSSFEGISVPDCISQGESIVKDVLQYLRKLNTSKQEVISE
ncbi:protoporphyrinogen oxidase [Heyndrickxia sporothermodurans]|uniref:Coproporphyrinogen III oxidase n=1 Tax=Heyndrickxia sporothermodurans TaxID=46224 RepID=A0A150KPU7_9BACI|nr:protoporphyrinogen oxidase [Heyndrickxia sporothermodurans]KYC97172.1 Protoporphyrinogen IX oxidase, aerobic, HemY [Heyndrickxia sporothermodurans]MBL5768629.1 protoporphyrinogen oxidase [Heyndrickxia sporothermodurans]MBL5770532.1 protoporphyrinogen oxidase [Heyndrickxia sporothermodurans]MBL5774221.1 protoporphyrinogen oxidase [Heyndrickxia sporothermodurans]MBL5784907.1 protoporphyrinogen oxidase [Heyndrickxia sporothermodurans]